VAEEDPAPGCPLSSGDPHLIECHQTACWHIIWVAHTDPGYHTHRPPLAFCQARVICLARSVDAMLRGVGLSARRTTGGSHLTIRQSHTSGTCYRQHFIHGAQFVSDSTLLSASILFNTVYRFPLRPIHNSGFYAI